MQVTANSVQDFGQNGNVASAILAAHFDQIIPNVTITRMSTQAAKTRTSPIEFQLAFSEVVQGFPFANAIDVGGLTTSWDVVDAKTYSLKLYDMSGYLEVSPTFLAGFASDLSGNTNREVIAAETVVYDDRPLTATITRVSDPVTRASPLAWTATFNKEIVVDSLPTRGYLLRLLR